MLACNVCQGAVALSSITAVSPGQVMYPSIIHARDRLGNSDLEKAVLLIRPVLFISRKLWLHKGIFSARANSVAE